MRRSVLWMLAGMVAGAVIVACVVYVEQITTEISTEQPGQETIESNAFSFDLTDQNGMSRSQADYAGKYKLVYFGYTYCPTICPTDLAKMTDAFLSLPVETQKKVQPLFITIDPDRDTPEVLKGYVELFMPELVGLTGSAAAIGEMEKIFGVSAVKVPDAADPSAYTMDHTSFIYLTAPDGEILSMFRTEDSAEKIREQVVARSRD